MKPSLLTAELNVIVTSTSGIECISSSTVLWVIVSSLSSLKPPLTKSSALCTISASRIRCDNRKLLLLDLLTTTEPIYNKKNRTSENAHKEIKSENRQRRKVPKIFWESRKTKNLLFLAFSETRWLWVSALRRHTTMKKGGLGDIINSIKWK